MGSATLSFAGGAPTASGALPSCGLTDLVPVLQGVAVDQGLSFTPPTSSTQQYTKLVRGKETLVRFYFSLPATCTVQTNQSIAVTGASLTVSNGTSTFTGIAPYASLSSSPLLRPPPAQANSPADPLFVVPGADLAPAGVTAGFPATFTASLSYIAKSGTASLTPPTPPTFVGNATFERQTNALRVLVVPMGDGSAGVTYSSQFGSAAQTAVQNGAQTLGRLFPVPAGSGELRSTTGGTRYTIDLSTLINVRAVTGAYDANGKFCGNAANWDAIKGLLAQYRQTWNTNNPGAYADRVLGVVDSNISDGGSFGCFEGMGSVVSQEAWVRAIPDTTSKGQTVPSYTGALMGMEIAHTFGLVPNGAARSNGGYHSINVAADGPVPNRAYNVVQRSFLSSDHTVMNLNSSTSPWNNANTLLEAPDYADLLCALGGATTTECTGAGTAGTATGVAAGPAFVMSGTTDGTVNGTSVVNSYFATDALTSAPDDSSPYRLIQKAVTGSTCANQGVPVSFVNTEHEDDVHEGGIPHSDVRATGVFSVALPTACAARIEFWKLANPHDDPGVSGSTLLYARDQQAAPPVVQTLTTSASGTPVNYTQDASNDDAQPALSVDRRFVAWTHSGIENPGQIAVAPTSDVSKKAYVPIPGKVAFVSARDGNADIYTMYTNGANPTRLTSLPTIDTAPAISPDGKKIAFTSQRDGNDEIYVMNIDGSNPVRLTNNPADDTDPAWSADGKLIAFTSNRAPSVGPDGYTQIYTMKPDGTDLKQQSSGAANVRAAAWAPDVPAQRLAWQRDVAVSPERAGIAIRNINDATGVDNLLVSDSYDDRQPSWSPDGTQIAYSTNRTGNYEIFTKTTGDSAPPVEVTDNGATNSQPDWTPDRRIAFTSNVDASYYDPPGESEIYVIDASGSNQTRLTFSPGADNQPSWSPISAVPDAGARDAAWRADGGALAFVTATGDDMSGIYTVPVDTSSGTAVFGPPTLVYKGANPELPAWSPDGAKIAFDNGGNIYVVDAGGGAPTALTTTAEPESDPTWRPDGNAIAYTRRALCIDACYPAPPARIWALDPASPATTQALLVANDDSTTSDTQPSYGGAKIAFTRTGTTGSAIWTAATDGTGQAQVASTGPSDTDPSLTDGLLAFSRSLPGDPFFQSDVMLDNLVQQAVSGTTTSTAPAATLRADLVYECGGVRYPAFVGLSPSSVTGAVATFTANFDSSRACGSATGGKLLLQVSDGTQRNTDANAVATEQTVASSPKPPVAAIYAPSQIQFGSSAVITANGSGKDAENGQLPDGSLQWSLLFPGATTPTAEGSGTSIDLKPPAGGWPLGDYTLTLSVTDASGATASDTRFFTIVDGTPPLLALKHLPYPTGTNTNNPVPITIHAADLGSGLASVACTDTYRGNTSNLPLADAQPPRGSTSTYVTTVSVSGYGTHVVLCSATDVAGNVADRTNTLGAIDTVQIVYTFIGFLSPISNIPTLNTGKPGHTYPVKWQLKDSNGAYVSSLGVVVGGTLAYQGMSCPPNPTAPITVEVTGGTVLRYDSGSQTFVFNWQTPATAGCYTLFLRLTDDTVRTAYFKLSW